MSPILVRMADVPPNVNARGLHSTLTLFHPADGLRSKKISVSLRKPRDERRVDTGQRDTLV